MTGITRDSTKDNLAKRLHQLAEMKGDAARFQAQSVATTIDLLIDIAVEDQLKKYILRQNMTLEDYHATEEGNIEGDNLPEHPDRDPPREAEEAGGGDSSGDRASERSQDPKEA